MSDEIIQGVVEALDELLEESSLPRNIKEKILGIKEELQSEGDLSIKVNRVFSELDEISDSTNLPSYIRTQIWNISSLLERA